MSVRSSGTKEWSVEDSFGEAGDFPVTIKPRGKVHGYRICMGC